VTGRHMWLGLEDRPHQTQKTAPQVKKTPLQRGGYGIVFFLLMCS
jgi:hypothetical protein